MNLLPTGHCFDDALEYLEQRVRAEPALAHRDTLQLVHGIGIGDDGTRYAHAWCEEQGLCWDAALLDGQRIWYSVAVEAFYTARRLGATTRYTIREACLQNVQSGHYGPWEPTYQALCGGSGRVLGRVEANASGATIRSWEGD